MSAAQAFADAMRAHGITPPDTLLADGQIHRFPTNGRKNDTAGGYVLHVAEVAAGAFWDWRSGVHETWCERDRKVLSDAERQALDRQLASIRVRAGKEKAATQQRNRERNRAMWKGAQPVAHGDPVARYLASRGLELATFPPVLRYHPALDYWEIDDSGKPQLRGKFPAMLAAVQKELPAQSLGPHATGVLATVALHRTYLLPEGRKADVPSVKKLTGTSSDLNGAAIRLAPIERITAARDLGVAEGIETALAAEAGSGVACWAAVSANGMTALRWPAAVQRLWVFADNDLNGRGQAAASELARRAQARGLVVRTLIPPQPGTDWADVWKNRA